MGFRLFSFVKGTNMSNQSTADKPHEFFAKITQLPRPFELVECSIRNQKFDVAIWILTQQESISAQAEALRKADKLLGKLEGGTKTDETEVYFLQRSAELLSKACRMPEELDKPFFRTSKDVLEYLTQDEIATLINQYVMVQSKLGPWISQLTEAEMEAWIQRIIAGGKTDFLGSATPVQLIALVIYLVNQLSKSQTSNSLSSLPQDDSSTP